MSKLRMIHRPSCGSRSTENECERCCLLDSFRLPIKWATHRSVHPRANSAYSLCPPPASGHKSISPVLTNFSVKFRECLQFIEKPSEIKLQHFTCLCCIKNEMSWRYPVDRNGLGGFYLSLWHLCKLFPNRLCEGNRGSRLECKCEVCTIGFNAHLDTL